MLTADQVRAAAQVLAGVAVRTPLLEIATYEGAVAKPECLQLTGSFKFRGAYVAIAALPPERRSAGVIGASSGNHAQALSRAARMLGTTATVVVPSSIPEPKLAGVRRYGATVLSYESGVDDRDFIVARVAQERGLTVIPSSDAYDVMAGAGTVALEILQDRPDIETLLVPLGGGGIAAGCATIATALRPSIRVVGVEPAGADDTARSFRAGHRVRIDKPTTIADGLLHATPAELPYEINQRLLADVVTVPDDAILAAMRLCLRDLRVAAEPSGATAMAALVADAVEIGTGRIAVVVSGGNADWICFQHAFAEK